MKREDGTAPDTVSKTVVWQRNKHKEVLDLQLEDLTLYAHSGELKGTAEGDLYKGLAELGRAKLNYQAANRANWMFVPYLICTGIVAAAAWYPILFNQKSDAVLPKLEAISKALEQVSKTQKETATALKETVKALEQVGKQ